MKSCKRICCKGNHTYGPLRTNHSALPDPLFFSGSYDVSSRVIRVMYCLYGIVYCVILPSQIVSGEIHL